MMPPNPNLERLTRLSKLALFCALLLIGWLAWTSFESAAAALQAKGWARAIGVPKQDPSQFAARCIADAACGKAVSSVWEQRFPAWVLGLPLLGFTGMIAARVLTRMPRKDPGEARWATAQDMRPYLGDGKPGAARVGYLGLLDGKHVIRLPENARCAHTLIIGGTGAGKTTRYVNPNLLMDARDGVSAVVFDLKYPDPRSGFMECINYFKAWGRHVFPFTPFDPDSVRVPLITGINTVQDALAVAEAFRPSGGKAEEGAAFYRNNERQLLAGLVLAVAQEPHPSMRRIFELLGSGSEDLKQYVKARPFLKPVLGTIMELRGDVITGIATGLMGDLLPFTNPNLDRATSEGEGQTLDLEKLCEQPGFLYIGIPQEEIQGGQGQVLLRLIKRVLDKAILSASGKHGGRLPVHLSIYLDEFPSFGPLPNIAENLATMRSRRVAYHIAMQNLAQGQAVYGKEEFAGMINNNFAQMVVFPRSLRLEDATYFAEIFGEMTVLEEGFSRTVSGGAFFTNPFSEVKRMKSGKATTRFLLSAEAMRTFPDGSAVVETIGSPPAQVRMPRLDERDNPYRKLFERIRATYKTPQLRKPGVQAQPAPSPFLLPPPTPEVANRNPLAESFRTWVETLLQTGIPVQAELEDGKPSSVRLERRDLPDLPEDASVWTEKGWLEVSEDGVIVPRLGLSRVTRLFKIIVLQHSRHALLRWVADHGAELEGHPRRQETIPALGAYRGDTVYLEPSTARALVGEPTAKPETLPGFNQPLIALRITGEDAPSKAAKPWASAEPPAKATAQKTVTTPARPLQPPAPVRTPATAEAIQTPRQPAVIQPALEPLPPTANPVAAPAPRLPSIKTTEPVSSQSALAPIPEPSRKPPRLGAAPSRQDP